MKEKKNLDIIIKEFMDKTGDKVRFKGMLIPLLQKVQELEGYLAIDTIRYISKKTGINSAEIYGVATFYTMFRLKPQGKNVIRICKGTACHVSGANLVLNTIRNELNLSVDEETTADGVFTVMEVACLGCCSLAPVIMINKDTHGKLTTEKIADVLTKYH